MMSQRDILLSKIYSSYRGSRASYSAKSIYKMLRPLIDINDPEAILIAISHVMKGVTTTAYTLSMLERAAQTKWAPAIYNTFSSQYCLEFKVEVQSLNKLRCCYDLIQIIVQSQPTKHK